MSGHRHNPSASTQNQGNTLGDRSCVRQSKLYRQYESGNGVKDILGSSHLCWDQNFKEGAYKGQKVFDHNAPTSMYADQSVDPRYAAQDMKSSINNSQSGYSRPPADRRQSLTKYEEQDRSIGNIGNYQQTSRNQFQADGATFRGNNSRHEVPEPIQTSYKSLKAQKNRDDSFREQGRGSVPQEESHSLARYTGGGDRRVNRGRDVDDEEEEAYNKYSDRNYGARSAGGASYGREQEYRDENNYGGGRGNNNNSSRYNDREEANDNFRGGGGGAPNNSKGNKSTRPW